MSVYSKKIADILKGRIINVLLIPKDIIGFVAGYVKLKHTEDNGFPIVRIIPILGNNHLAAGGIDRHYFLQDIYMAQKVRDNNPENHYDIGSRVDGFISHLLCDNIPVTMIDIRPLPQQVEGLTFIQSDATSLTNFDDSSIGSLSTLHAIEHFGLSRYGDSLDIEACKKAMKEIQRVIKENGFLYFSVPISKDSGIVYNSHRVFKPSYILEQFDKLVLISFAFIHDYSVSEYYGEEALRVIASNEFDEYDCGMFVFTKPE